LPAPAAKTGWPSARWRPLPRLFVEALRALANELLDAFERDGVLTDLDEAVERLRETVAATLAQSPDLPGNLARGANLGSWAVELNDQPLAAEAFLLGLTALRRVFAASSSARTRRAGCGWRPSFLPRRPALAPLRVGHTSPSPRWMPVGALLVGEALSKTGAPAEGPIPSPRPEGAHSPND
jgi:hypothetical protein